MLGMLVRADHRGLATLTGIMARCLNPERVLLVDMGRHSPTACHPEQYPDRWGTVTYDDLLAGTYCWSGFLDGLDAVYTAEIPYDFRLFSEASKRGVKTVMHVMPELDPYVRDPGLSRPDVMALPTEWMQDRYPGAPLLPVPSEPFKPVRGDLVVHPGSLAMKDRNGTRVVLDASLRTRWPVVVRAQTPPDRPHGRATVEVADLDESHDLFSGAALVVIPRRYGGLSIVIQEALSAGLPLLLPESDPYAAAVPPVARLRAVEGRNFQTKGGTIVLTDVTARAVAERIELVMADDGLRRKMAAASRKWARDNAWEFLKPAWDVVLGVAVSA